MKFTVPWKPRAKERPRVVNGRAFTPKTTREAESQIRTDYLKEPEAPREVEGPIAVEITMRNESFDIEIVPTVEYEHRKLRGDIDNYAKTILDALNGVAWVDDKQITHLTVRKS